MSGSASPSPEALVARLGGHPTRAAGIDLDAGEAALCDWLELACLLGGRTPESAALAGYAVWVTHRGSVADSEAVASALAEAGVKRSQEAAALLARLHRARSQRPELTAALRAADDLEAAGGAIVTRARGVGPAAVLRFLRPLRGRFAAAAETPLAPAACAAGAHLGWHSDPEAPDPGPLLARLADAPHARPADVEAALERLGAAACRRERSARCPLGSACPARGRPTPV